MSLHGKAETCTQDELYEALYHNIEELDDQRKNLILKSMLAEDKKFLGLSNSEDVNMLIDRLRTQPIIVAMCRDNLAGFVSFGKNLKAKGRLSKIPYIRTVLVMPEFRQKGVGGYLLKQLLGGNPNWWCIVHKDNIASLKLFCKFGFRKIEQSGNYLVLASGEAGEGGISCKKKN